jgi:hypothetical protein
MADADRFLLGTGPLNDAVTRILFEQGGGAVQQRSDR